VVGAVVAGASGSCWGVALATLVGALTWWWQLEKALDEHVAGPAEPTPSVEHEGMSS
jgi:hypothetical protein